MLVGFISEVTEEVINSWLAGGAAYYFAKKSINADRAERFEKDRKRRQMQESLEYSQNVPGKPMSASTMGGSTNGGPPRSDHSASPSQESTIDPAPTRHAPENEGQRVKEKSKYEASEPFRAKKGDRFS